MSCNDSKPQECTSSSVTKNSVLSLMCLAKHPEIEKFRKELQALPPDSTALDRLLQLTDRDELKRRGILLPADTEFEITLADSGGSQADAEIEVCVGGTTTIAPFVTVKLPKVCKKIAIPNPFD